MIIESPQFFTVTILEWKRLLKPDKYKEIEEPFVGVERRKSSAVSPTK